MILDATWRRFAAPFLLAACLAAATVHPAAVRAEGDAPKALGLMAGSSLVEDIVLDLSGNRIAVRTLIPASACPGHHDIKVSDATFLGQARAILLHDWQRNMGQIKSLIESDPAILAKVRVVPVSGNWMIPDIQVRAVGAVADILCAVDPDGAAGYRQRAAERQARVARTGQELRQDMARAGAVGVPVLSEAMQAPFVAWLGFSVPATYGRFEETGPEKLAQAMYAAKAAKARIVADNLQSTGTAGKALAEDLGATEVCLTNFPGGFPEAPTWETSARRNLALLLAALKAGS